MTPIQKQIYLMKQAINIQNDIENVNRLIKPFDPVTCKVMVAELQEQYSEITQRLFSNFLTVSGAVSSDHPQY